MIAAGYDSVPNSASRRPLLLVAAAVPITVPRLRPFDAAAIPTVGFFV